MLNDDLMVTGHFVRKSGGGSAYNYALIPLIQDFSFQQFVSEGRNPDLSEHGGFIVVTDKQYVCGYTAGFGSGSHNAALGRVMKDMHGGGEIHNFSDNIRLCTFCKNRFPTARFIFEKGVDNANGYPTYNGYIQFEFADIKITPAKLASFEKFYSDYNEEIKAVCRKNKFYVNFSYIENGMVRSFNGGTSLDEVYEFMKNAVDYDAKETSSEKEIIIGVPNEYGKRKK